VAQRSTAHVPHPPTWGRRQRRAGGGSARGGTPDACRKARARRFERNDDGRVGPTQQQPHVMGLAPGRERARGSALRSRARTYYRRKALRIVSTPRPFTGVRSMRSRLVRSLREIAESGGAEGRAGDRRVRGSGFIVVHQGEIPLVPRGEHPRDERCESGRSELGVVKRQFLQLLLRDESRVGSGGGEPRARVQVIRWKRWQKSVGRIAAAR